MGLAAPGGMTLNCDVAITAGGIGGLTLASSLAQRPVSVFEQDNELRQIGVGAGTACANARVLPGTAGFVLGPQQARAAWFSGAAGVAIAGAPRLITATVRVWLFHRCLISV